MTWSTLIAKALRTIASHTHTKADQHATHFEGCVEVSAAPVRLQWNNSHHHQTSPDANITRLSVFFTVDMAGSVQHNFQEYGISTFLECILNGIGNPCKSTLNFVKHENSAKEQDIRETRVVPNTRGRTKERKRNLSHMRKREQTIDMNLSWI